MTGGPKSRCPVCEVAYSDDTTACFRAPDKFEPSWTAPLANGWCSTKRLKWSE